MENATAYCRCEVFVDSGNVDELEGSLSGSDREVNKTHFWGDMRERKTEREREREREREFV